MQKMIQTISRFSLRSELLSIFLLVATIPLITTSVLSSLKSSSALERATYEKFEAVQAIKKQQIKDLFEKFKNDITGVAKSQQIIGSIYMLESYAETCADIYKKGDSFPMDIDQYPGVHRQLIVYTGEFIKTYGYDDFILINSKGQVCFTAPRITGNVFDLPSEEYREIIKTAVAKELSENLHSGRLKDSGLAQLWRTVLQNNAVSFQDFTFYEPDKEHVFFIGAPVFSEDDEHRVMAVVALKVSADRFNAIMNQRTGMGQTGIFLLVGKTETGDIQFRNDIQIAAQNYSETHSLGDQARNPYFQLSFEGDRSLQGTFTDSTGDKVIVASVPVQLEGLEWNIVAKINVDEAMAPVSSLRNWMLFITVGGFIAILIGILFLTRYISGNLNAVITSLRRSATEVDEASSHLAGSSNQLASGASEQAASIEETSAQLKELGATSQKNASTSKATNEMALSARTTAGKGSQAVDELADAMQKIMEIGNKIEKVSKDIEVVSFQTNLLALNAAVEAARAGESGRGFAVVAGEVRNLAQRVKQSALTTNELVSDSRMLADDGIKKAQNAKVSLDEICVSVDKVTSLVEDIVRSSDDQAGSVVQIETAVAQMNNVVQSNSANAEETSSSSQELSAQASTLKAVVDELFIFVNGEKAFELARDAEPSAPQPVRQAPLRSLQPAADPREQDDDVVSTDDDEAFQGF